MHDTLQAPLPERFASKFTPGTGDQCWGWTAATSNGYGRFHLDGRTVLAHRLAYAGLVGPIPDGLEIDHLCRVRHCVNPSHLEPVTSSTNKLRGSRKSGITHCPAAHPYDEANTYVYPDGSRNCRACRLKQRRDAYRARLKESV